MTEADDVKRLRRRAATAAKKALSPCLEEMGFTWIKGREAQMVTDVGVFAFEWRQVTSSFARIAEYPSSSIDATFAVHYRYRDHGASFLRHFDEEPFSITLDQMDLRCFLTRSAERGHDVRYAQVWPIATDGDIDWAVSDCIDAINTQGAEFLRVWGDPQQAFDILRTEQSPQRVSVIGQAGIFYPGNPGSSARNQHLAWLADLLGDVDAERDYLQQAGVQHHLLQARLAELDKL